MIKNLSRSTRLAALAATLFALAAGAAHALAADAPKAAATFGEDVIVKGKGFEIKRNELDEAVIAFKANLAGQGRTLTPQETDLLEKQLLAQIIQLRLLLTHATDADRTKGKEVYEKRFEELKSRAPSEEAFNRQLRLTGMNEEKLRAKLTEESTAEAVVERDLNVTISDDEVKKFYDENPSKFEQPEMVRASHILIGTRDPKTNTELTEAAKKEKRKQIDALLKRARDGEDFAKLAKENTDDEASRAKGGEYTFGRGQMVPEFERAAFSLKTNQVSDVVTTSYGYHIIKLSEKLPAKKLELDDKMKDRIRQFLKNQEMQKRMPEYSAKLRKEAGVEILDENLKLPDKPAEETKPAEAPKKDTSK